MYAPLAEGNHQRKYIKQFFKYLGELEKHQISRK